MKKTAICIAVLLMLAGLAGCGGGGKNNVAEIDFEVTTDGSYPVDTDKTLTYWVQLHESVAPNFQSLNETRFGEELIAQTGINVQFIHPPVTQVTEKFNLLIASRDYPDIIEWGWYGFTGGPHMAIEDKIILPLNSVIEKAAPNLRAYLEAHPAVTKDVSTDEGEVYSFPFVRENDYLNTYYGPMFRKDFLDRAGLDVPETVEEWEAALYAFRDMGVEIPLMTMLDNNRLKMSSPFLGAYGVMGDFYVENAKVKFGPYEEEPFSKFITLMTKWYKDGVLDPNFVDTDNNRATALGLSGKWGAAFSSAGGGFGAYIPAITKSNPAAQFVPAKYPVLNKGDRPKFGQKNFNANPGGGCAAITTQCDDIELAARLLDFAYTDAGYLLYNFGKAGESYDMIDGVPTYKEIITNQAVNGGKPISQMIAKYARASYFGPMIQSENYMKQYAALDAQKQGITLWSDTKQTEYALPYVTLTAAENNEYSGIMADVNTYRQEQVYKFITGTEPLDKLPEYFSTLKSMGLERAIEINQAAYERYLNR
ncbi:MAG: extracellular solute-binding protein [Clostridiales bacterium]|jgi:putative aldouronate transport system substrate-binding protein|nr:extracellular solute-binding protein [Clostridiales bacterium]